MRVAWDNSAFCVSDLERFAVVLKACKTKHTRRMEEVLKQLREQMDDENETFRLIASRKPSKYRDELCIALSRSEISADEDWSRRASENWLKELRNIDKEELSHGWAESSLCFGMLGN